MRRGRWLLAAWLCLPQLACPVRSSAGEVPVPVALWPPVIDQPALTDADVARFITANTQAEASRHAAEDRFVAELPVHATPGAPAEPMRGADFAVALERWTRLTANVEAEACLQTGVSYDEYRSTYKRLLQVNDLIALRLKIESKRQAVTQLTERDLHDVAREQFKWQRQRERQDVQHELTQLEKRRVTLVQLRLEREQRKRDTTSRRLQRVPLQEKELAERLAQLQVALAHARQIQQAQQNGGATPMDPRAQQAQLLIEGKIARIEEEIARTRQRQARLTAERQELERASVAAGRAALPTEDEVEIGREISARRRQVAELGEAMKRGPGNDAVAARVEQLRVQLENERIELARLEQTLDTQAMRQAMRDHDVVIRHGASLTAFGAPIVVVSPPAVD